VVMKLPIVLTFAASTGFHRYAQAGAKLEGLHPTGVEQHNTRRAAPHLYMVLFRSLMIVVNAVTDDFCRFCHERWVEILVGRKLGERRFIAEQHAVEYTVLAHQIFGR
jgi:hypothetical protein